MDAQPVPTASVPALRRANSVGLIAVSLVVAAFLASYAPNIAALARQWQAEPNYSHGFLVAPLALMILWQRRERLEALVLKPSWLGWVGLIFVLGLRAWLYIRNEQWAENATIILVLASLVLAFGGRPLLRWAGPALGFLIFMLPLPPRLNLVLAGPLQRLATIGSTTLLHALGLPVLAQGNVIFVGGERLEVAQACNGLSMLLSFVTLVTAIVILLAASRPLWEQGLLLLSAIPIALAANILRIAATAWAYHAFGREAATPWPLSLQFTTVDEFVHDTAGWAMVLVGLVLAFAEMELLKWLVIETAPEPERRLVLPPDRGPGP